VVGSFEDFVPEPKDIEACFVTAGLNTLKNQNRPIFPPAGEPEGNAPRSNANDHFLLLTYCLTQNS
jgi:hypothetical protein